MERVTSEHRLDVGHDGETITLSVPLALRRTGGRKQIILPAGETGWSPPRPKVNEPLVAALVRAFHWQSLLDAGRFDTVADLARAHRLNSSYVARMLRLTLLAPDIVEAILDGQQPSTLQLHPLCRARTPSVWERQRWILGFEQPVG